MNHRFRFFALLLSLGSSVGAADLGVSGQRQFFENEIRPILANRCYECHGEKKTKAGLRLDSAARFAKGGDSGALLVAGNPDQSLHVQPLTAQEKGGPPRDEPP